MGLLPHYLILLFIIITFLISGIEKITDWKGQVDFFKSHFDGTFLKPLSGINLGLLIVANMVVSGLAIKAIYDLIFGPNLTYGLYATVGASIVVLALLFGQRIAKDYQGAASLTSYFMVTIFGVYLFA